MMVSKLLVLGLVLVGSLLLISSEMSARELAEETAAKNKEVLGDTKQYGYGGYPGRGYGGYPGGGYGGYPGGGYGGGYPGGGYGGGYQPWRRPYCRWGCCGRGWYGGGCRCCIYPGQVPDAGLQTAEP